VSWNRAADKDATNLFMAWREIGGPVVAAAPQPRYGLRVIRELIPHELHGSVDLAFAPGGVGCTIRIPL
jgi:two-component sensor histidine kinase